MSQETASRPFGTNIVHYIYWVPLAIMLFAVGAAPDLLAPSGWGLYYLLYPLTFAVPLYYYIIEQEHP